MDLYEITYNFKDAKEQLDEMIGLGQIDEEAYQNTVAGLDYDFDEKVLDIARYIKDLESRKKALENALYEMGLRKQRMNCMIEKLKSYLKVNMETLDKVKIQGVEFDVSLRRNPPKLVLNEEELDDKWYVTKLEKVVDKKRLKEACKTEKIFGAELVQENRIEIK